MITKEQLVEKQIALWREIDQVRANLNALTGAWQVLAGLIQEETLREVPTEDPVPEPVQGDLDVA